MSLESSAPYRVPLDMQRRPTISDDEVARRIAAKGDLPSLATQPAPASAPRPSELPLADDVMSFSVYMPESLNIKLIRLAAERRVSKNYLILDAIKQVYGFDIEERFMREDGRRKRKR